MPNHNQDEESDFREELIDIIKNAWNEEPSEEDYKVAARGLGLEADQVPRCGSKTELQIRVFMAKALGGSFEHFRELGDRAFPKPSRMLNGAQANSTRGKTTPLPSQADAWFDRLDGDNGHPPEVLGDDDLM